MGNSPGAQQNPTYCMLAGALNVSFNGGVTWTPIGGGGGGTIHTSAPLSGDGSVGTPATIAPGAVPLTALAMQVADTFVMNATGGAASPTAASASAAATILQGAGLATAFGTDALFRSDFNTLFAGEGGIGLISDSDYIPMTDSGTYDISQGTNKAIRDNTFSGGVLTAPHGGAGTGYIRPANAVPSVAGQTIIADPATGAWAVGGHLSFALSPNSSTIVWSCMLDSNVDDSVAFYLLGSASTTVMRVLVDGSVSGSGSTTVACNAVGTLGSGITVGSGNFYRFVMGFNPVSGNLFAGVNGVLAATVVPGTKMPTKAMSPAVIAAGLADVVKVHGLWQAWV